MAGEFEGLFGPRQPMARADVFYNNVVPDYLKYQQPSPMPPPGTSPGKIGPPSGQPSFMDIAGHALPDVLSFLNPEAGGLTAKVGGALAHNPELAAVFLSKLGQTGNKSAYSILDEAGKTVANTDLIYKPKSKDLWVSNIWGNLDEGISGPSWRGWGTSPNANTLGTANMRSLIKALKDEYPEAETLSGQRISGARVSTGGGQAKTTVRLRPPTTK